MRPTASNEMKLGCMYSPFDRFDQVSDVFFQENGLWYLRFFLAFTAAANERRGFRLIETVTSFDHKTFKSYWSHPKKSFHRFLLLNSLSCPGCALGSPFHFYFGVVRQRCLSGTAESRTIPPKTCPPSAPSAPEKRAVRNGSFARPAFLRESQSHVTRKRIGFPAESVCKAIRGL